MDGLGIRDSTKGKGVEVEGEGEDEDEESNLEENGLRCEEEGVKRTKWGGWLD